METYSKLRPTITVGVRPCKACGQMIEEPATVCCQHCWDEVYNESKSELYEDERHPYQPDDNEETEEETEEV